MKPLNICSRLVADVLKLEKGIRDALTPKVTSKSSTKKDRKVSIKEYVASTESTKSSAEKGTTTSANSNASGSSTKLPIEACFKAAPKKKKAAKRKAAPKKKKAAKRKR